MRYSDRMLEYFVYILHCSDDSYYIGITNDVPRRLEEHRLSKNKKAYMFKRRPFKLVYQAMFHDVYDAIAWEKKIKGWSRQKKEALIKKEYEKLPRLSLSKMPTKELLRKIEIIEEGGMSC